jgi:hypothetical protein
MSQVPPVIWRAAAVVWAERARMLRARLSRSRHVLASVALVVLGLGGGLAGGALVGEWCLGLVMIAESCLLLYMGLARDDGQGPQLRGARSHAEILDAARRAP